MEAAIMVLNYNDSSELLLNSHVPTAPYNASNGDVTGLLSRSDFPVYAAFTTAIHEEVLGTGGGGSGGGQDEKEFGSGSLGFGIPDTVFTRRIVHYCFGTLLTLFGVAGFLGNGLVLYVFARYRRLRGGGGPLILSLASGDCMVSVLHFMPAYSSFKEDWAFGDFGCEIYAASVGIAGLASLITLSVIAADRFSVIMGHPIQWISGKKAFVCIWLMSGLLVFPPFVGWSRFIREGLNTSCSWDYASRTWNNRSYYIYLLFFGFVVPVTAVIVSYVGILIVICQHSSEMNGVTRNGIIHSKKRPTKSDLRTAQVILTIIICFLLSWTPYALVSLFYQFGPGTPSLSPLAVALPAVFAKASVVYNPIVYGLSHPHFRSAVRMLKARHLGGRHYCGPHDRYHYQYSAAGFRAKKPLLVTRSRCHNDLKGLQDRGSQSRQGQEQTTDAQTTLKTYDFSRNSYDEVLGTRKNNKRGWAFLKMHSRDLDSGHTLGTSLVQDRGISSVLESTSYSEPERLDEEEVVRMSPTHSVCQYRRRKTFLGRSFFHSENCLTHLLRITDPDFLSTPESSKAKKDGESGLKMTTIVSLNSRGGGTTTCVTAKKSEIISFIGANNLNGSSNGHNNNNNNNNNSRGSTKDRANGANCSSSVENKCLMVGTTSSSNHSSGRPFMGVPDPNVNTSRALKLTLSKSDESFPRSAFWFLRQRTCGKGPGGCQLKRAKCIRRKGRSAKNKSLRSKHLPPAIWLRDFKQNGSSSFGNGKRDTNSTSGACVECRCVSTHTFSKHTMPSSTGGGGMLQQQSTTHHHEHLSDNNPEGFPTVKICQSSGQNLTLLSRTNNFNIHNSTELIPVSCDHKVGNNQSNNNKDKWKHATSTVMNLIRTGIKETTTTSSTTTDHPCPGCRILRAHLQIPNSLFIQENPSASMCQYHNGHHKQQRHQRRDLNEGNVRGGESIEIMASSNRHHHQVNRRENSYSYYQESFYSDGGSDTFYSCN